MQKPSEPGESTMTRDPRLPRRSFVHRAVAVGGAGALAACIERESGGDVDLPQADTPPDERPRRQHAWNDALESDEHGNVVPPEHHLFLLCSYEGETPTADERERVEEAFGVLDRAYQRGSEGLSFTVGYSPAYFERFDESLPESVDLPKPTPLAPFEEPALDDADLLVHLASDYGQVVLAGEQALRGDLDELNGIEVSASLSSVCSVEERREGFVGAGLPTEKARDDDLDGVPDPDSIPEDAPFFMGFTAGFAESQASEDRVTITDGPFAGGTTTHLSAIRINLRQWFEQDSRDERIAKLFSPGHVEDDLLEGAGNNLGSSSGISDYVDDVEADARAGTVGHAQKAARAREDGEPIILRRDVNTVDGGRPGLHFLAHQRRIEDFVRTREAMNGTDLAEDSPIDQFSRNGILQYLTVYARGNYLVPPREYRALPSPQPE